MSRISQSPSPFFFPSPFRDEPPPISFERSRRISHPHNNSQGPRIDYTIASQNPSSSQQRPNLHHQASQTVVDLTDDLDDILPGSPPHNRASRIPSQANRRTATAASMDVVDLTDDDDVVLTGARPLHRRLPQAWPNLINGNDRHRPHHRPDIPLLELEPGNTHAQIQRHNEERIARLTQPAIANRPIPGHLADLGSMIANAQRERLMLGIPQVFNYAQHAFAAAVSHQPPARKPEYVAPPAVQEGFTRSPTEDDVVICPGCEEELVAQKVDGDYIPIRKNGKAPSKQEREQHPFWVVRDCGHVFCNSCYQNRAGKAKGPKSNFIELPSAKGTKSTKRGCPVDGCESEVGPKTAWIGIFL